SNSMTNGSLLMSRASGCVITTRSNEATGTPAAAAVGAATVAEPGPGAAAAMPASASLGPLVENMRAYTPIITTKNTTRATVFRASARRWALNTIQSGGLGALIFTQNSCQFSVFSPQRATLQTDSRETDNA